MDGVLADLLDLLAGVDALHMGVRAKLQIDLIGIIDQLLGELLADEGGQVAADLIGEAQFAVRERAGTREAGGDGAGGAAVDAVAQLCLGAVAFFHRLAFFHQQDVLFAAVAQQLHSGKNTGRAGAHNDQIVLFHFLFILFVDLFVVVLSCRSPAPPRHSRPHGRAPRPWLRHRHGPHPGQ